MIERSWAAMKLSTKEYALLWLLQDGPQTGLELARRFRGSDFWPRTWIYVKLMTLERLGLVESYWHPETKPRPNFYRRRLYKLVTRKDAERPELP